MRFVQRSARPVSLSPSVAVQWSHNVRARPRDTRRHQPVAYADLRVLTPEVR